MRNWAAERPVAKGVRVFHSGGKTVTVSGKLNPYNELLDRLADASKTLQRQDRKALQRLAWFLGVNGETHACEAIMEHAREPEPYIYCEF